MAELSNKITEMTQNLLAVSLKHTLRVLGDTITFLTRVSNLQPIGMSCETFLFVTCVPSFRLWTLQVTEWFCNIQRLDLTDSKML